jgi:Protein of unknown function (DUF2281)
MAHQVENSAFELTEIPAHILASMSLLSTEQRQQVFDFVEFLVQKKKHSEAHYSDQWQSEQPKRRVLGQHKGMGWMSDDFDQPLPDAFWLGEETEDISPT